MIRNANYSTGWMDSSVHQFLEDLESPASSMKYVLVTCLDSGFDVASLLGQSQSLKRLEPHAAVVGTGILLATAKLLKAQRSEPIFCGFDEIWFFPTADVTAKPAEVCITGPDTLKPDLPGELIEWMENNRCSLGLGDGTGLNFVARLRGVAKHLVNEWTASVEASRST